MQRSMHRYYSNTAYKQRLTLKNSDKRVYIPAYNLAQRANCRRTDDNGSHAMQDPWPRVLDAGHGQLHGLRPRISTRPVLQGGC
jgi:hypothetical protein